MLSSCANDPDAFGVCVKVDNRGKVDVEYIINTRMAINYKLYHYNTVYTDELELASDHDVKIVDAYIVKGRLNAV